MDLQSARDAAIAAAREAGSLLRADFHRAGGARGREDKAEADLEAERLIRARLLGEFPGWGYLGEETGRQDGSPGAPVWLVDPNDGTRDYLAGRRGSTVSIGLVHEGRPVLGVVFAFAYPDDDGDLFAWAEGCGALRRNGAEVHPALPAVLVATSVVLVSSSADRDPDSNLACSAPARYRAVPSIAHRLALLACGEGSGVTSLYAPGAWDYAAGHALLRAAGGVLVNETGAEVSYAADGSSGTQRAFAGSVSVAAQLAQQPWHDVAERRRPPARDRIRLVPGEAVSDVGLLARAQGCLLGQIAGDSLGSLVEFASAEDVAARHPDGPRELVDGGRWNTLAGQPTDDSEMALALARSILETGSYSQERAIVAYRAWRDSGPFDIGGTTRSALAGYLMGESQANGSLMRVSPLGVFAYAMDPARVAALGRDDSVLTHPHPVAADAVAAFAVAIAHAVRHGDGPRACYDAALAWARGAAQAPVVETLERAEAAPPVCDRENEGWVLIALRNAFFEALHAASLEDAVVATVRRGGDTDTNAAITGALLGAIHGRSAIPPQWREMVLSCRAHPARARHPRPPIYWPVDALEIAERLLLAGAQRG